MSSARAKGYQLLYWATGVERTIPLPLLQSFSGSLVDRKVTYRRALSVEYTFTSTKNMSRRYRVSEYPQSPANQQLLALALLGGENSRFHIDSNISREKFVSMYHIWINRSTLHEIADVVFVLTNLSHTDEYLGVVTGSVKNGCGKIGLMGVQKDVQGQGIGSLLIATIHAWMLSNGATMSEVVTQSHNVQACKFYERSGYQLASLQHYYHFWIER